MTARGLGQSGALAWVGIAAGPFCWFLHQQFSLWLMPQACAERRWVPLALWPVFALLLIAGGMISWGVLRHLPASDAPAGIARQRARFLGILGTVMPLIFFVALLWQGSAALIYSGCER